MGTLQQFEELSGTKKKTIKLMLESIRNGLAQRRQKNQRKILLKISQDMLEIFDIKNEDDTECTKDDLERMSDDELEEICNETLKQLEKRIK